MIDAVSRVLLVGDELPGEFGRETLGQTRVGVADSELDDVGVLLGGDGRLSEDRLTAEMGVRDRSRDAVGHLNGAGRIGVRGDDAQVVARGRGRIWGSGQLVGQRLPVDDDERAALVLLPPP